MGDENGRFGFDNGTKWRMSRGELSIKYRIVE